MAQSTKTAIAAVIVIALAGAFWLLLLAPKREKASELSEKVTRLSAELTTEQLRVDEARLAKQEFPRAYRQLVLLGKAVPAEAATPSLLVQINGVSARADTRFQSISMGGGGSEEAASETGAVASAGESLLPIGASVGPTGLPVMPYSLQFQGGFFEIADFISGLDSLVTTGPAGVNAKGRLVTIDGFTLSPDEDSDDGNLNANFQVTTYVAPPDQGLTAGATASGPASTTTTETP